MFSMIKNATRVMFLKGGGIEPWASNCVSHEEDERLPRILNLLLWKTITDARIFPNKLQQWDVEQI
jgi:hypothetical protein